MPSKAPLVAQCNDGRATLDELQKVDDHDVEIKYRTFARHVDIESLSDYLGYAYGRHARGIRLGKDYHVHFFRSRFRGRPCYHLDWSAIDHIFQIAA